MGADKLRKVIKDGLNLGFLRFEGKNLIANKIHGRHTQAFILKRDWFVTSKKNKGGKIKFRSIRAMIETAIIVNHVNIQQSCADTHYRATSGRSVQQIRSAKKRESRMLRKDFDPRFTGLSYFRIQQLIDRKKNKAVNTIKCAVSHDLLTKQIRERNLNIARQSFNALIRDIFMERNETVITRNDSVVLRLSNEYRYIGNVIKLSNHGL